VAAKKMGPSASEIIDSYVPPESLAGHGHKPSGRHRLQIDVSDSLLQELDRIKGKGELTTRAAVVRKAVKVYGMLLDASEKAHMVKVTNYYDSVIAAFPVELIR
jgi:thiamine monophosphate kinase